MKKFKNITSGLSVVLLVIIGASAKAQMLEGYRATHAENRCAILPIVYIGEGNPVRMEEMRYRLQNLVYAYLQEDAREIKFQNPAETNALLFRNGVDETNVREFTPGELAAILNVEYVLTGMVNQESMGLHSVGSSVKQNSHNHRGNNRKYTIEQFKTREEISTTIDLSIYNDKGETVFSKSRHSIWSGVNAYTPALQYLLKRTPLYKR